MTPTALREELGDLLFQVVFHAEIGAERGEFTMADLLARLGRQDDAAAIRTCSATRRCRRRIRHSRSGKPSSSARPRRQGRRRSVIDGVPRALPALVRAQRIQSKAARVELRLAGRAGGVGEGRGGSRARRRPRSRPVTGARSRRSSGTCCSRS